MKPVRMRVMIQPMKVLAGLMVAGLVLSGCSAPIKQLGGQKRTRTVNKIVSLSPSTTEVVTLNTASTKLIGRTENCDSPGFIKNVDVVVKGTKPDYERIAAMKPDLVAYDATLYSAADVEKIKQLGAEVWAYNPKTLTEYEEYIVDISQRIKDETQGSKILDDLYQAISTAKSLIPEGKVSAAILIGGGGVEYMACGTKTLQADIAKEMHITMTGPDVDVFGTVNVEQILAWNPSMILTTKEDAEKVFNDPRLASLSAIKNKRVFGVEAGLLLRAGSRLDKLANIMKQQSDRILKSGE